MKHLADIIEGLLTSGNKEIETFDSHIALLLYKLMEDYVNSMDDYIKAIDDLKLYLRPANRLGLTGFITIPKKDNHIYISFTWVPSRLHNLEVIEVWYNDNVYVICWDRLMGLFGDRNHVNSFELDVASWMDLCEEDADSHGKSTISRIMYDIGNVNNNRVAGEVLKTIESIRKDKI